MGVRFDCHECGKRLNIKEELAGKRGVCPACGVRFRIPQSDAERSVPLEGSQSSGSVAATRQEDGVANSDRAGSAADTSTTAAAQPVHESPESGVPASGVSTLGPERPVPPAANTDLLSEDPDAVWYVRPPSGGQYGPASGATVKQWIAEGRVTVHSLLWRDGWPQWRQAGEAIPDLANRQPSGPATSPAVLGAGQAEHSSQPDGLSGQSSIGSGRSARTARRVMWIGVLAAIVLVLLVVLWIVVLR